MPDIPILGSVPEDDTNRLTVEQRLDQLEEFARWITMLVAAPQTGLADQVGHIAGALVAIVESVKAEDVTEGGEDRIASGE